jgi:hypothetical protein
MPIVCEPGLSYTAFVDHCVPPQTTAEDFRQKKFTELGDFYNNAFDYKIKKTEAGIKAALNRQGSIVLGDKTCPLSLEKVLGLEKDSPALPFVYQFSNHSLTPYSYMLIIEFTFALPGIAADSATLLCKKEKYRTLSGGLLTLSDVSQWYLSDPDSGVGIQCTLQKPIDLWCYPVAAETEGAKPEAITIALAAPVALEGSSVWSIMGKLQFKRVGLSKKIIAAARYGFCCPVRFTTSRRFPFAKKLRA